ncbi:hypothetical protein BDV97DRAFT_9192 [Delphinella strobiligena]|nr:hypothetical protein BDV97DRAFT_9192 [Delphinella strobiligena]
MSLLHPFYLSLIMLLRTHSSSTPHKVDVLIKTISLHEHLHHLTLVTCTWWSPIADSLQASLSLIQSFKIANSSFVLQALSKSNVRLCRAVYIVKSIRMWSNCVFVEIPTRKLPLIPCSSRNQHSAINTGTV